MNTSTLLDIGLCTSLEFWNVLPRINKPLKVCSIPIDLEGGTARDIVKRHWNKQPKKWNRAVVRYLNGDSMLTYAPKMLVEELTNSNAYSAPNFNFDTATSTAVADMTALKGGAPAATDLLYMAGAATFTIEASLIILKIINGHYSTGAAGAGLRYAIINVAAGITISFGGHTTNTNSGVLMSPTTADTSSKSARVNFNGTSGSHIILTNVGNAFSTSQYWTIQNYYGSVLGTGYVDFKFANVLFSSLNNNVDKTTATSQILDNCTTTSVVTGCVSMPNNGTPSACIPIKLRFWTHYCGYVGTTVSWGFTVITVSQTAYLVLFPAGASFDLSGTSWTKVAGNTSNILFSLFYSRADTPNETGPAYVGTCLVGSSSTLPPTTVLPTGLTFYDPGTDGELWFTISNLASYANADVIKIYNAAGDAELGATSKTRYAARAFGVGAFAGGYGVVPALTNGTLYTLYAKATSDNNTFSTATATATGTPTLAVTNQAFLDAEAGRNKFKTGSSVADILTGKGVTLAGVDNNGTYAVTAPSKPVITARVWGSGKVRIDWTASSGTNTYTVKRGGVAIATGLIDTVFYLDTGLAAGSYTYTVEAVGASTVASDPVTVTATLTDSEKTLWDAIKDVLSTNAALVTAMTGGVTDFIRTEPGYDSGDDPVLRAWPYIVDPTGTKLAVYFGIQIRRYGTTVTMEDNLMTLSKIVREALDTLPSLYPLLDLEILPEQTPECSEAVDANFNEEYVEVKVSVV